MSDRLDPQSQPWMLAEGVGDVLAALAAKGGQARFVGGAVRNALIGEPIDDVDIATTLLPDDVMTALRDQGISAIPTGIAYGTVTAVVHGKPFEITTLRRDVSTDGRHARVAYSTDWAEDAARRDFTINAIYLAQDGTLFDPTGGTHDLRARRVRFVGDAKARIREDYLRILRLFRFHAWYGRGTLDRDALDAAKTEKAGLKQLSGERVRKELLRLLEANDPMPTLRAMQGHGILAEIFPEPARLDRLERLLAIVHAHQETRDPILSLAALLPSLPAAQSVATRLVLSNADSERLIGTVQDYASFAATMSLSDAARLLYRLGGRRFLDRLLLGWAERPDDQHWEPLLALARTWAKPAFPLGGRDALAAGIGEGPAVGRVLADLEKWWAEQDFVPDRAALLTRLKERADLQR